MGAALGGMEEDRALGNGKENVVSPEVRFMRDAAARRATPLFTSRGRP